MKSIQQPTPEILEFLGIPQPLTRDYIYEEMQRFESEDKEEGLFDQNLKENGSLTE